MQVLRCHAEAHEQSLSKYADVSGVHALSSQGSDVELLQRIPFTRGGGGLLKFQLGRGVLLGVKTGPCLKPLGAQKIHPVTIYLTKNFHMHTLLQYCTPRIYPVRLLFYSKKK